MGYTTDFTGEVTIEPPLNENEIKYLTKFAETRRMDREQGPYYVNDPEDFGQGKEGVRDFNAPPEGQPGLWCQWVPTSDGTKIKWDGGEKFYDSEEWMVYIIDHFLRPDAKAASVAHPQFSKFTFDHVVNGVIVAQGEDPDDKWALFVKDNEVESRQAKITYE